MIINMKQRLQTKLNNRLDIGQNGTDNAIRHRRLTPNVYLFVYRAIINIICQDEFENEKDKAAYGFIVQLTCIPLNVDKGSYAPLNDSWYIHSYYVDAIYTDHTTLDTPDAREYMNKQSSETALKICDWMIQCVLGSNSELLIKDRHCHCMCHSVTIQGFHKLTKSNSDKAVGLIIGIMGGVMTVETRLVFDVKYLIIPMMPLMNFVASVFVKNAATMLLRQMHVDDASSYGLVQLVWVMCATIEYFYKKQKPYLTKKRFHDMSQVNCTAYSEYVARYWQVSFKNQHYIFSAAQRTRDIGRHVIGKTLYWTDEHTVFVTNEDIVLSGLQGIRGIYELSMISGIVQKIKQVTYLITQIRIGFENGTYTNIADSELEKSMETLLLQDTVNNSTIEVTVTIESLREQQQQSQELKGQIDGPIVPPLETFLKVANFDVKWVKDLAMLIHAVTRDVVEDDDEIQHSENDYMECIQRLSGCTDSYLLKQRLKYCTPQERMLRRDGDFSLRWLMDIIVTAFQKLNRICKLLEDVYFLECPTNLTDKESARKNLIKAYGGLYCVDTIDCDTIFDDQTGESKVISAMTKQNKEYYASAMNYILGPEHMIQHNCDIRAMIDTLPEMCMWYLKLDETDKDGVTIVKGKVVQTFITQQKRNCQKKEQKKEEESSIHII